MSYRVRSSMVCSSGNHHVFNFVILIYVVKQ